MDHMVYQQTFGIYYPSSTVTQKSKRGKQKKHEKQNPNITQYGQVPKLVLELYDKNKGK